MGWYKCEVTTQQIKARLVTASVGKGHAQVKTHVIILTTEWITCLLRKASILLRVKVFMASAVDWCWPGQGSLCIHDALLFPQQGPEGEGTWSEPRPM